MRSKALWKVDLSSLKALVKRQPWLYTLWFLSFFFSLPVATAMQLGDESLNRVVDYESVREFLTIITTHQHPLLYAIIPVGAFVTVMCLFSYLHSRRQVDFFHSQPIPRGQIFTERVLAGLLVMLVPYLINLALTVIIAVVLGFGGCLPWLLMLKGLLWTCGFYLGIFGLFLIGSLLAGQSAVNVLVSLFLAGVGPALIGLFYACVTTFYENAYTALWNIVQPVAYTNPLVRYWLRAQLPLEAFDVAYLLIFSVLALGFCYYLFLRRPSEGAEQALAFRIARLPIKLPLAVCATLGLAALFYVINYRVFWWYFGGLIGAFLCCQIYEIIYATDFRGGARRFTELALIMVIFIAASLVMWQDMTGFNDRLPELDKVAKVELQLAGFDDYTYSYRTIYTRDDRSLPEHERYRYNLAQWPVTSEEGIAAAYSVVEKALACQHGELDEYSVGGSAYVEVADAERAAEAAEKAAAAGVVTNGGANVWLEKTTVPYDPNFSMTTTVGVRFTLENGKTLQRFYSVALPLGAIREEIRTIINDEAYIAAHYDLFEQPVEQLRLTDIQAAPIGKNEMQELGDSDVARLANVPQEQLAELLEVYRGELLALSVDYRLNHAPIGRLTFGYWESDPGLAIYDDKAYGTYWSTAAYQRGNFNYPIYECMSGTIALLDEYYDYDAHLFEADFSTAEYLEINCYSAEYYEGYLLGDVSAYNQQSIDKFEAYVAACGTPEADGNIWGGAEGDKTLIATYWENDYSARLLVYDKQLIEEFCADAALNYYNEYNPLLVQYPDLEMCYNYRWLSGSADGIWLAVPYAE